MSEKCCSLCQLYTVLPQALDKGICHLNPPAAFPVVQQYAAEGTITAWSIVIGKTDWCSHFMPKMGDQH